MVVESRPEVRFRAAEFFAGAGLVRSALEAVGGEVVFANDIEPFKHALYAANFDARDFVLGDVRDVTGHSVPSVDLATSSFPCTDLSLAGNQAGLLGEHSSMFWEFARVLREMGRRRPRAVLLENVPSFITSKGGRDLADAIAELNALGYVCDLLLVDARKFVPQSRPRLFIVGSRDRHPAAVNPKNSLLPFADPLRPARIMRFIAEHPELKFQIMPLEPPVERPSDLTEIVERFPANHEVWWSPERVDAFTRSLSPIQGDRLHELYAGSRLSWATAYRRTRRGHAVWEIRGDGISGCLRTARGGSSKQAIVEAGRGQLRVRWMVPVEYARLQGAPDFQVDAVSSNQALFALGDAVCVPAVQWILDRYVLGLLNLRQPARIG